jgi:hypothetical protein
MRSALYKLVAALMAGGLAAAVFAYPLDKAVLGAALLAWLALLWRWPHAWLLAIPALLPVLDLAPYTGSFYLEELDLLLLGAACVGYARLRPDAPHAALPPYFIAALLLVALTTAVAAVTGLLPLPPLDANAFASYSSRFNSLRVAKGFAWALVLLPLLRAAAGAEREGIARLFVPGMLLGLAAACAAVTWERAAFPGLLNFSSDYRPTAPFSAMHVGGAALDAYLGLCFPFVAAWLVRAGDRRRLAAALVLLLLGAYAGLATFSRDMYLSYAVSGGVIVLLLGARRLRGGARPDWRAAAAGCAALLACGWVLTRVFATGGYRGLACAIILLAGAMLLAGSGARVRRLPAVAAGAVLVLLADLGVTFFAGALFDGGIGLTKGPYLGFALVGALGAAGAAWALLGRGQGRDGGLALAAAAFPALACSTIAVAHWWGGAAATLDAALAVALACLLVAANRLPAQPLWRPGAATLTVAGGAAILFAVAIPLSGSYYLGERFSTTGNDMEVRLQHWSEAVGMMDEGWQTSLFGMGLGRYPDTYFWRNRESETPPRLSYENEGLNQFLRLSTGAYPAGYGETLRALQMVALAPGARYRLSLDLRSTSKQAVLAARVCERWLIYPQRCLTPALPQAPADGAWHHYEAPLPVRGAAGGLVKPTTQLELSNGGVGTPSTLDVDNVSLVNVDSGAELVRNGGFADGNAGWFFSSDRNHMPWHVKNFVVNMFFEQGWLGCIAMGLLLLTLAADLAQRALRGETMGAVYLAALSGMMVVGLFDSLVDVPRLTLLLLLVASCATLRPAPPKKRRRRSVPDQAAADLIA